MRKHYVTFYSPGTFVAESSTLEIDSWDTAKAVAMSETIVARYNARPYCFVFSTDIVVDDVPDGEGGTLKVEPKEVDRSGFYFLGGRLETYDDVVARNDEKESILRSNMRNNEHWIVCINDNSYRSTVPFEEDSCIVNAHGMIVQRGDDPKLVAYRSEQLVKRAKEYGY